MENLTLATNTEIVSMMLLSGFAGLMLGAAMVWAFFELKFIIEKRDDYDETL